MTIKAIKQSNLFKAGEEKYYIQFIQGEENHVINVGKKTWEKVDSMLNPKPKANDKAR